MPAVAGNEIAAAVRCAVFKVDLRGNLIYIDDETEELSGLSRDELFGKSIYDFVPDDCRHLMENILSRPKRHDMVYQAWPVVLKTAANEREEFHAIVTLNFIGESPANYQFILMPGDGAAMVPPNDRRFPKKTAGRAVESRCAAARKLVCAMAHDLRAPLITMDAFSRKLTADHGGQLDDKGRFALACLTENARILRRMIDGLGELAANWTAPDRVEKVAVGAMIDDLVTMFRATYPETEYIVESGDDLPVIEAPRKKLIQVFRNILDNAFKYSAAAAQPRITITHRYENGWHRFSIGDNGPGIDQRYHARVFEPFFRTPEAGAGDIPGTGMGLAIVHDIITGWGGHIHYESSPEAESVFVFGLPGRVEG